MAFAIHNKNTFDVVADCQVTTLGVRVYWRQDSTSLCIVQAIFFFLAFTWTRLFFLNSYVLFLCARQRSIAKQECAEIEFFASIDFHICPFFFSAFRSSLFLLCTRFVGWSFEPLRGWATDIVAAR